MIVLFLYLVFLAFNCFYTYFICFSNFYGFLCFNGVIIFESILSIKGVQLRIRLIKGISSFISFYVFCDLSLIWGDESF